MAHVFGRRMGRTWRRLRHGDDPSPVAIAARPYAAERAAAPEAAPFPPATTAPPPVLVDSSTRTWWKPGSARSETLVETVAAPDAPDAIMRRVAAMTAASAPSGKLRSDRVPGTADPAFTELLLVELLREGRWERAFDLLAPECQAAWGSSRALAAEHAGAATRIAGARVAVVRALDTWEDRGTRWHGVAELVVEYALRTSEGLRPLRRTVHLVDAGGRWRSLLFPPG
jgi:hypothetical protein